MLLNGWTIVNYLQRVVDMSLTAKILQLRAISIITDLQAMGFHDADCNILPGIAVR